MFDADTIETFSSPGTYEDRPTAGPIARRIAARAAAERAAIGRPSVFSPIVRSPFTRRALASQLPVKEYAR